MNSFAKNIQQLFSVLLALTLNSLLHAITFRNEPLTNFINPGEVLCAHFSENTFLILEMENDDFDIKEIDIHLLSDLEEVFEEVAANPSGPFFKSKFLNMSGNILNYNSSYLGGREKIDLQGRTSSKFNRCLFESPLISITGDKMKFVDSFLINPEVLNIIIEHPGSEYEIIQLIFYEQPELPTFITGKIDLNNNKTAKQLIISNVKEIRMQFKWRKSLPENSEFTPELIASDFSDAEVVDADGLASVESLPIILEETVLPCVSELVVVDFSDAGVDTDASTSVEALPKTSKKALSVNSNSRSRSAQQGFIVKYYQKITAFAQKLIKPYF
jgi:hypothetical protein